MGIKDRILELINNREEGNQAKFARRINIPNGSTTLVRKWLSGEAKPKTEYRQAICAAYGVSDGWLNGENEKDVNPKATLMGNMGRPGGFDFSLWLTILENRMGLDQVYISEKLGVRHVAVQMIHEGWIPPNDVIVKLYDLSIEHKLIIERDDDSIVSANRPCYIEEIGRLRGRIAELENRIDDLRQDKKQAQEREKYFMEENKNLSETNKNLSEAIKKNT